MFKRLQALIPKSHIQSARSLETTEPDYSDSQPLAKPPKTEIALQVQQERLRQARHSFNLSLVVLATAAIFGFAGIGLMWAGKTTESSVAATGSLLSSFCGLSLKLAKDAGDRLK
jgi:hypothetical protein